MLYRIFGVSCILLLTVYTKIYADSLRLEDFGSKIGVKMLEMNEEYIKVIVPESEIGSISIKSTDDGRYTDTVSINVDDKESSVTCKILKITKTPASITLLIPRGKVAALQIDFPGSETDMDFDKKDSFAHKKESRSLAVDTERLKEQIKEELMYVFEKKQEEDGFQIEEKIKNELSVELENKQQIQKDKFEAENYGKVTGRMLIKGRPLPGCQVKITKLDKWALFDKPEETINFEGITDGDGRYSFKKVPPGGYKLYWKPSDESSWIRSIKMEPDFFVEKGETCRVFDRETNIRTIN